MFTLKEQACLTSCGIPFLNLSLSQTLRLRLILSLGLVSPGQKIQKPVIKVFLFELHILCWPAGVLACLFFKCKHLQIGLVVNFNFTQSADNKSTQLFQYCSFAR